MGVLAESEFDAIDTYLQCKQNETHWENVEAILDSDQEVPIVKAEPIGMYTDTQDLDSIADFSADYSFSEELALCIPNTVTVADCSDGSSVSRGQSPDLLDLDSVNRVDQLCQDESLYEVEDILMLHLKQDIHSTCSALRIPPDSSLWSVENVRQWIQWQCRQREVMSPRLDYFQLNGADLSGLTEEEFKARAPGVGSDLYWHLVNWNTAARDLYECQTTTAYQQDWGRPEPCKIAQDTVPCWSPSPSSQSDDSMSSSSCPLSPDEVVSPRPALSDDEVLPEETTHKQTIQLWQFLKQLLLMPHLYSDCIKWIDRSRGVFKIENSMRVAKLWGARKNRPAMNYDKLSRSIRQYYKKGIIKKTEHSKRLVYQFCNQYL